MKTMKRTLLVGASMFALTFGLSAQVDDAQAFEAYQAEWTVLHGVTQMTPALYTQMKTDWVQSVAGENERVGEMPLAQKMQVKQVNRNLEQGLPADYPFKATTGNPQADEAAYQLAKELWIQNNPGVYNQMSTPTPLTAAEQEERNQVLNN